MKKGIIFAFMILILSFSAYAKSGSMKLLAVSGDEASMQGSTADLYLEVKEGTGRVFIDSFPLSKIDTQISTRFAKEVACNFLDMDCSNYDFYYTIRANSAIIGGPSAGAAITILTISVLDDLPLDSKDTITGTINTGGIIGPVGGVLPKISAGAQSGMKKILIPKYSQINETNITEYEKKYGIKIVEVSQLNDAVKEMTGRDFSTNEQVNISSSYVSTMQSISFDLCSRAASLINDTSQLNTNTTATDQLKSGTDALDSKQFYSAASFCFGSALNSQYKKLKQANMNSSQIKSKIDDMVDRINEYRNFTQAKDIRTITDLEAYMAVSDRLVEARDRINDALYALALNDTNASLYNLAYGTERLNSARSWGVFFGQPGQAYTISKKALDDSCLGKISEVEERIQYLDLYLPSDTDASSELAKAYSDYNSGDSALCLYEASVAKGKVDTILNAMAIDTSDLDKVIEDRSQIVRSILAKQTQKGSFPILGYSYYEYATSLKKTDKYSALLYLEYAIELGNLDIYFEKHQVSLPLVDKRDILIFSGGALAGIILTSLILRKKKAKGKK